MNFDPSINIVLIWLSQLNSFLKLLPEEERDIFNSDQAGEIPNNLSEVSLAFKVIIKLLIIRVSVIEFLEDIFWSNF